MDVGESKRIKEHCRIGDEYAFVLEDIGLFGVQSEDLHGTSLLKVNDGRPKFLKRHRINAYVITY